jgi:large conductance mechanosensitive channel
VIACKMYLTENQIFLILNNGKVKKSVGMLDCQNQIYNFATITFCLFTIKSFNFMSIVKEFKEFAVKGNVIDLAVGVIIGAAFGKIVTSLVADVIMPPIGWLVGGVNFTDLKWHMKVPELIGGARQAAVTINYGNFIQVTFDFIIVAFAVFLFVKGINRMNRKKAEEPVVADPEPTKEELLLTEIRDLLKNQK